MPMRVDVVPAALRSVGDPVIGSDSRVEEKADTRAFSPAIETKQSNTESTKFLSRGQDGMVQSNSNGERVCDRFERVAATFVFCE